jgi:class 3 adenylate cyclase
VNGPDPQSREDELRTVTVLFADIVGSTALGERLAPDEVKALIGECVSRMSRAVEEYGGMIQAYMGDGICAYFGVPVAHEDDPERAARSGLRILEVVGEYSRDIAGAWGVEDFNVRVGINTGQTAVGLVGAGDPQAVALGDTTNLAARLQSIAAPGTIVVGTSTAGRLLQRFAFEALGEIAVKGRAEPVEVARLVRPQAAERPTARMPLVGRAAEIARLEGAVGDLKVGRGQVLLLMGEAGIGKTRLLGELRALTGDTVTWLEGHCLSYGGLVGWPFIEMLRQWLGVEEGDAELAVRTKARARLGGLLGAEGDTVLSALARLLRIRLDPALDEGTQGGDEDRAAEIRDAYSTWIEALSEQRPIVVALEDLHWADATTRQLAEHLLELTDRAPLLVTTTMSPDTNSEGWRFRLRALADYAHRTIDIGVGPLTDEASGELAQSLLPGALDEATKRLLIERAEGNPLYLEELVRALVEAGGMQQRRRTWTVTVGTAGLLPGALENLLVARIDRLPPGPRRLVETAAVIGRQFPVRVLERVSAHDDLHADLAVLLRAQIVQELRRYPELECAFKHGLVHEAALSTLTPARRVELYGRVAAAFEELFARSVEDHLERLAHYHAQSGNVATALSYLERAAANAAAIGAGADATQLWRRAHALADQLGDAAAQQRISERITDSARGS